MRTRRQTVVFRRPFRLQGVEPQLTPGAYVVETDEEAIEGISRIAWRRVKTVLHLPSLALSSLPMEMVTIDGAELERALEQDRQDA